MDQDLIIYTAVFIVGAAIGSFVNVVALRYGSSLSFIKGKSECLACGKLLQWHELLPVISYLKLRGRCAGCLSRFSIQYFLVEVISGVVFIALYIKFGPTLQFLLMSIIYYLLSIIFIYDLRHKIIPDGFVLQFIILAFLYRIWILDIYIWDLIAPAIIIPLPFFLIWLLSRGRMMGLGDVKFMIGMGLLFGLSRGISAVFLAFWIGSAYVFILYLLKKIFRTSYNIGMKSELPFAPFLVVATLIAIFFNVNLLGL